MKKQISAEMSRDVFAKMANDAFFQDQHRKAPKGAANEYLNTSQQQNLPPRRGLGVRSLMAKWNEGLNLPRDRKLSKSSLHDAIQTTRMNVQVKLDNQPNRDQP